MADHRGEYWYLDNSVDANKITVPELRSILLKHGVTYPSSAKKPALVSLFIDYVVPQAAQVRRAQADTKRSTRGIVDVPSSSASTVTTDDTGDETLLPPPSTVRRTSRRTTRQATEDRDTPAPRAKTPSRAVPAKHSRAFEPEEDERPAARRTRKSVTPAAREPSPDPEAWHRNDVASPFTQENPFQSGSSPALPDIASRDRRRKTLGSELKDKRKSDAHRRKTFQPNAEQLDEGIVVPSRGTFDVADPRQYKEEDSTDAGEEFTPEEQLELVRDRAKAGKTDMLPPRRRRQRSKASGTIKAMSLTLLSTALVAFAGVWRQEKIAVGFCGIGRDSKALAGVEVPDWLNEAVPILPQCEPCPPHAQCFRGLDLRCDSDFIRKEHPLSLGGLIPLPPTCEPDSEKTRKVNSIANRAVQVLRQRNAQYECSEPDAQGNLVESPKLSEKDLKQQMAATKSKGLTDQEFGELFDRAFPEVALREEVVVTTNGTTGERRLASTSLAELPVLCSIRRSVRRSLKRYLFQIVITIVTIATVSYGNYSYKKNRSMEARAKQLASDAFERLANQAAWSIQDPSTYPDKGISMAQLRDDVLRDEFSASRRKKLWERVQKKVERNANIRAAVKTTNTGDVARMWEWVGPTKLLEDGRSSRFSFGNSVGNSPPSGSKPGSMQKWDEGRPIY
ncbi:sister chromatid separation protein-like protein [Plenodomus tracheiphilus IPT5]|uniref:Sister chromatid separation protein-like protein n=1 Tax=Plenodomus tracheiphilus IPT5 TaxID=1408161 RepID=A0A6A7BEE6_9PLEO|nr:sister chromatid separation protein-like protein [Plenodomus tracheiphilus IPT5]